MALPLIVSTGMWSLQSVIDRAFLTWYSNEAVAAAMGGGILAFTILVLFTGTAAYCNTFVAQYVGAKLPRRVGVAVWQAIFFGVAAGIVLLAISQLGAPLVRRLGRSAEMGALKATYFRIVLGGSGFLVIGAALSSFFSGREDTVTVMIVSAISVVVNVTLNYLWIFGYGGFPEMGVAGAAMATVVSYFVNAALFFVLMLRRRYRERFGTLSGCKFDRALFRRLLRFGLPSGATLMLEMTVWALFLVLVEQFGLVESAATAIAFNVASLGFMPMVGVGIAVSTLVGKRQGEYKPDLAARTTWSALHLAVTYMGIIAALLVLVPGAFLSVFSARANPEEFAPVAHVAVVLLRYVALMLAFDGLNIIFLSAIKGAGDTRFPLIASTSLAWGIVGIPSLVLYGMGCRSVYVIWALATAYLVALAFVVLWRFLGGKWRTMRVIEEVPPPHVIQHPAVPPTEIE